MRQISLIAVIMILQVSARAQVRTINGPGGSINVGGSPAMPGVVGYVNGQPLYVINQTEIEGSPYLDDQWGKGVVYFKNGKATDRVPLKLSLYDGQLYFDMGGNSNVFIDSIQRVRLWVGDTSVGKARTFLAFPGRPAEYQANTFMELLEDGDIRLLKYERRDIEEYKDVSQAVHRRFKKVVSYYVMMKDGELKQVRLSKESLSRAIDVDLSRLDKVIADSHLKLKGEATYTALIHQLNTTALKAF